MRRALVDVLGHYAKAICGHGRRHFRMLLVFSIIKTHAFSSANGLRVGNPRMRSQSLFDKQADYQLDALDAATEALHRAVIIKMLSAKTGPR